MLVHPNIPTQDDRWPAHRQLQAKHADVSMRIRRKTVAFSPSQMAFTFVFRLVAEPLVVSVGPAAAMAAFRLLLICLIPSTITLQTEMKSTPQLIIPSNLLFLNYIPDKYKRSDSWSTRGRESSMQQNRFRKSTARCSSIAPQANISISSVIENLNPSSIAPVRTPLSSPGLAPAFSIRQCHTRPCLSTFTLTPLGPITGKPPLKTWTS